MLRNPRRALLFVALLAPLAGQAVGPSTATAEEIGFWEDFALAADRELALKQLIPGTEDYYYFHCLHHQNLEQFEQVDQLLKLWIERYKRTPRVRQIETRQALLTYGRAPKVSLDYVRTELGLRFDHQRVVTGQKPNLATTLDEQRISRPELLARALRQRDLSGFENSALHWLAGLIDGDQRRLLLQRVEHPDLPNLVALVDADLRHPRSGGFGSLPIHSRLLLKQLDQLLKLQPALLNHAALVRAYLAKLAPGADEDWALDTASKLAHLERLWAFVQRLGPVHNSLKAHVLFRRLALDRQLGVHDRQRFEQYLRLPRNVGYVNADYLKREETRRFVCNLDQPYPETGLPPVGIDEPLVRSYLLHLFVEDADYQQYLPLVRTQFLKEVFAEAKVVNGVGNAEQWYSLLPPAKYQQLKERVDLEFAATSKRRFGADEPVSLDLHVKHVETLLVKVFQINTDSFYRASKGLVNTNIELDGLVANWERTVKYAEPPLRRVRRHFEFPEIKTPGVYVIDFIGNGKNSRVVVQRGQLRLLSRTEPGGQLLTVLDEQNQRVPEASVYLGGKLYGPDAEGEVLIPYSTQPGRKPVIIRRGEEAYFARLDHQGEQYSLEAGIYVDRESLLARRKGRLTVRPQCRLNGVPVSLEELQETSLTIVTTDLDGIASTQHVADFKLYEDRASEHEFLTPSRIASITMTLNAVVKPATQGGKKVTLSASQSHAVNAFDRTELVADLHLAWIDNRYSLLLLGRSGEPMADRAVQLSIKHRDFTAPVELSLQTDLSGAIALGELDEISWVGASYAGAQRTFPLRGGNAVVPEVIHGRAGQPIELPLPAPIEADRATLSLWELRGGQFVSDQFDHLQIDGGLLRIEGLPAGDYQLLLKTPQRRAVTIRVAEGQLLEGWSSYVLGKARQLEIRSPHRLAIRSLSVQKDQLVIELQNVTQFARVHVLGTRLTPAYSAFGELASVRDIGPYLVGVSHNETLYAEARQIGEEYRYILERQLAAKFPGNMLERPSLLLNPWALRTTEASVQDAKGGDAFGAMPVPKTPGGGRKGESKAYGGRASHESNLDFLAQPATVLANLIPSDDAPNRIVVPLDRLGDCQHIRVVAADPNGVVERPLSLPERTWTLRDLRLADGLNPQQHFVQRQTVSTLKAKETLRLAAGGRLRTYDSLRSVYELMTTLSPDARLAEFRFLLDWHTLDDQQKREKYSEFASHELNFFLAHKDPEFFGKVVEPYLANKHDRTFLDQWLLDASVAPYVGAWRHGQLNVVERILIGHQLRQQSGASQRHVQELYELLAPDPQRDDRLFQTALKGAELDVTELVAGGVVGLRNKKTNERRQAASDAFGAPAPTIPQLAASGEKAKEAVKALQMDKGRLNRRDSKVDEQSSGFYSKGKSLGRRKLDRLYRALDKTMEWAENNYYKRPIEEQNADLVTVNAFWNDYANHPLDQPFLSRHFAQSSGNATEVLLALSVLGLPFEAAEHERKFEGEQLTIKAGSRMIVLHEEIQPAELPDGPTTILVSQNFFQQGDRYRFEDNLRLDKYVDDEFLNHTVYGCQVVVTNPTSTPRQLEVLMQLPVGAIAVAGGKSTDSVPVQLGPYATITQERLFYFPATGEYPHFPVHVSQQGKLLASAEPQLLKVVESLSRVDRESWDYISQNGTDEDVIAYLDNHNLQRTNLDQIAFRMKDKAFFDRVVALLAKNFAYNRALWSYSVLHDQPARIQEFLSHEQQFVLRCGMYLDSPLLLVDPVERRTYQQLDYRPLVNARAHQLGAWRQILNDRLHGQYQRLLQVLACRRELDDAELMSVTYYLLLQDRVAEALGFFERVNRDRLETKIQYDYFTAYNAFYTEDVAQARDVVEKHVDYPVDRWRDAFAAVGAQLDELEGGGVEVVDPQSRDQQQTQLAARSPSIDLKVEAQQVRIDYQNLDQLEVRYYLMDVELLFSRNPFVQQQSGSQFSFIQPNLSKQYELEDDRGTLRFALPDELRNRNVLVEARAGGVVRTQAHYSNSLRTQVVERYGHLRVTDAEGKPAPKTYVKAYAKLNSGQVKFYKDGYTDLRGRFDYSSLSTNELDQVSRFALLILSEAHGAQVVEAAPPAR